MEEKKKRLMELIGELNFPLLPEESQEHLEKLSEEDLAILISAYEAISDYRKDLVEGAKTGDPEKYKEVQKEYNKKFQQLNLDFSGKMEKVQTEEDKEKDDAEEKASQKIDEVVVNFQKEASQLEEVSQELASKIELGALTQD